MNFIQLKWISTAATLQAIKPKGIIVNKVFNFKEPKWKSAVFDAFATPVHHHIKQKTQMSVNKNKRVTILNSIFMRHISDLMATGEVAPNLLDKDIEITKVQVSLDFTMINVYWFSCKNIDDEIENILEKSAGHLQHELSQLQIIGRVPPISFIKDVKYSVMQEMENHFKNINLEMKNNETDNNDLSPDQNDQSDENEIIVPEMQQNVMGFNHSTVMNKIKCSMAKIQKKEMNEEDDTFAVSNVSKLLADKKRKSFDEFLKKRVITEKRKKRHSESNQNYVQEFNEFLEETEAYNTNNNR